MANTKTSSSRISKKSVLLIILGAIVAFILVKMLNKKICSDIDNMCGDLFKPTTLIR